MRRLVVLSSKRVVKPSAGTSEGSVATRIFPLCVAHVRPFKAMAPDRTGCWFNFDSAALHWVLLSSAVSSVVPSAPRWYTPPARRTVAG